MHEVAQLNIRVLCLTLLVLLLAACGSGLDSVGPKSGGQLGVQAGSGTPVDTEEAAIAADPGASLPHHLLSNGA